MTTIGGRRARSLAAAALAALAALGLAGCTVPETGLVGISRDANGHLIALIGMCSGHVDSVIVYETGKDKTIGTWDLAEPATDTASIPLAGLEPLLKDGVDYMIYAASNDNSSSAGGGEFKMSIIESLGAETVFARDHVTDGMPEAIMPTGGWDASVEAYCRDS